MKGSIPRHRRWITSILRELVILQDGRNSGLCTAAQDFREPIKAEVITREAAKVLLKMASEINGYVAKQNALGNDGAALVERTIESGLSARSPEKGTVVFDDEGDPE
jgi:hypothetical protein